MQNLDINNRRKEHSRLETWHGKRLEGRNPTWHCEEQRRKMGLPRLCSRCLGGRAEKREIDEARLLWLLKIKQSSYSQFKKKKRPSYKQKHSQMEL